MITMLTAGMAVANPPPPPPQLAEQSVRPHVERALGCRMARETPTFRAGWGRRAGGRAEAFVAAEGVQQEALLWSAEIKVRFGTEVEMWEQDLSAPAWGDETTASDIDLTPPSLGSYLDDGLVGHASVRLVGRDVNGTTRSRRSLQGLYVKRDAEGMLTTYSQDEARAAGLDTTGPATGRRIRRVDEMALVDSRPPRTRTYDADADVFLTVGGAQ